MVSMDELLEKAQDTLTGRRVFGEPIHQDGVTVIPAAVVAGGGGGGSGHDDAQEGSGGGFGLAARPAGVYVIDRGKVSWQPAVDVNRLVTRVTVVAVVALVVRWRVAGIGAKRAAGD